MTTEQVAAIVASFTPAEQEAYAAMSAEAAEKLIRKTELWDRLAADPDFQPEWAKAMGPRPKPAAHRDWADGFGRMAEHVIEDLSFDEGWVRCAIDGATVYATARKTTEDAWDDHRGRNDLTQLRMYSPPMKQANDTEVSSFLTAIAREAE